MYDKTYLSQPVYTRQPPLPDFHFEYSYLCVFRVLESKTQVAEIL